MRKHYRLYLAVCLTLLSFARTINSAILPSWNNKLAYHPDPLVFVHGMNSSPEAWGFVIDPRTEDVIGYIPITAYNLFQYFDNYLERNPDTEELLRYIEPFNYEFNTFDSIKWNAWEGYNNTGLQYPDGRISNLIRFKRLVLNKFIGQPYISPSSPGSEILRKYQTSKINLVAHSLGGVVSRYYINKTQGANVKQLTTLGTPHKGTLSATLADVFVINPVTDPFKWRIIWRVIFIRVFDDLDVNRKPNMIDELKLSSQFIKDLNSSIPSIGRYYCIGGAIGTDPIYFITDGFIELVSALGARSIPLLVPSDYQPEPILPNYKWKILMGSDHLDLPEKWEEILKAIDSTKPRIELTSPQEGFVWESGAPITIEGKVYDEYLPADCSIKIELYKAGYNDYPVFSEERKPDPITGYTPLKPSDLWRANDPNSPVAEFKEEITLPGGANPEATYTIKLTVINPAGISSEPEQVTEKTWYMYGVGMGNSDSAILWCIDGPTSFADGVGAVVSEFNLVDEAGNNISARPLDITTDGSNTIWVSFDNKKIYGYNRYTMTPMQLPPDGKYYWTTTGTPDGLYYDVSGLQYCSSETNRLYRVSLSGIENGLGVINRRLSLDGVSTDNASVNYTTQEYTGYNPTGISTNYLCSSGKISKRDTTGRLGQKFLQTLPSNSPIWTNEQNTPASCIGIVEDGGSIVYLSSSNGNVYKVKFNDKVGTIIYPNSWSVVKRMASYTPSEVFNVAFFYNVARSGVFQTVYWETSARYLVWMWHTDTDIWRIYCKLIPPSSFVESFAIHRAGFSGYQDRWDGTNWVGEPNPSPMADTTFSICSYNESWSAESADQNFNSTLITQLWTHSYETRPVLRVTDVTGIIPNTTFYYTGRYGNEGQIFPVGPAPLPSPIPVGYLARALNFSTTSDIWAFLTNNGSLETQDQFTIASGMAEGIAIGPRVKIRIEPDALSLNVGQTGQLRVNGKGPYTWASSDETVAAIEGISGATGTIKAVGVGTATITVRDSLGNMAKATVNVSAS